MSLPEFCRHADAGRGNENMKEFIVYGETDCNELS